MKNITIKYVDTYYYCNIIMNIINDINYTTTINQFFENYFIEDNSADYYKFPRMTIMHEFFQWTIDTVVWEEMRSIINRTDELSSDYVDIYSSIFCDDFGREEDVFIERLLTRYSNNAIEFKKWWIDNVKKETILDGHDLLTKYIDANEKIYFTSIDKLADEIFYILFQNRQFLLWFNETVASYNKVICERNRIPEWVKRTIRYRDKGKCVFCGREVSGKYESQDDFLEHFDHIVPLAQNGINCVTNMQLTCRDCNESKSNIAGTNDVYINWYDKDNN